MPSESLLLAVTSGLGVGIFAGIVSGVCYIVVTGFSTKRPRNLNGSQWHCSVCGIHFRSIDGVLESGRIVTCFKCGASICRARCSKLIKDLEHQKGGWECQTCQQPESWFKGILRSLQPSPEYGKLSKTKIEPITIDEMDEDLEELRTKEKQHVRDFIERLVEAMLGNNIDSARVTRIYNDQKYLPILGQSPCSAHASLKLLIQRIIQEAIGLPPLDKNDSEVEMHNGEVENRTYEDLLATAILNKVVENYQDELVSSKANSVSSRMSNSPQCHNDKEYYFGTETLCTKWQNGTSTPAEIDADATSVSSLDDCVRSDSSVGSIKYVDPISLKIQHCIEEISSIDDEAKVMPVLQESLPISDNEWQDNWLMQKRSFGRNVSPVPVPMLVPNPTSEAKVFIGDREADDTTDLSDAGSDFGDVESSHSIENILTSSKTVIGGKNALCNNEVRQNLDFELNQNVHHNEQNNNIITEKEDNSFLSFESQTEQDTEYTEKYGTLPRTILKSPTPNSENPIESLQNTLSSKYDEQNKKIFDETDGYAEIEIVPKQNGYHHDTETIFDEDDDTKDIFKGTYSEREKEKWNNAVEMKNNPYSTENLKRRLSNRSTGSVSSLFGKDYNIGEATKPADSGSKLASNDDSLGDKTFIIEDGSNWMYPQLEDPVYTAIPAFIQSDDLPPHDAPSSGIASPIPHSNMESSDSDLSIERIYNITSGNVYINEKSSTSTNVDCKFSFDDQPEITSHVPLVPELESIEKSMDFSLEFSTDDSLQDNANQNNNTLTTDPEITELCDKHLVKDILGRFSKSYPNLTTQIKKDVDCSDHHNEITPTSKNEAPKQVYSLTARSIPKEFREELKQKEEMPQSSSAILYEMKSEDSMPFPVAKSKIKYFESLKP